MLLGSITHEPLDLPKFNAIFEFFGQFTIIIIIIIIIHGIYIAQILKETQSAGKQSKTNQRQKQNTTMN